MPLHIASSASVQLKLVGRAVRDGPLPLDTPLHIEDITKRILLLNLAIWAAIMIVHTLLSDKRGQPRVLAALRVVRWPRPPSHP